jgi:uncharacterized membrane protein
MRGALVGAGSGVVLAFAGLVFGFWGLLLVVVLGSIGGFVGAVVAGRIDLRAVTDALRGRRSA